MEIGIAGGTQQPIFESFSIQMPKTIGFEFGHPPAKPHIDNFRKAVKEHLPFLFIKPSTSISSSRVLPSLLEFRHPETPTLSLRTLKGSENFSMTNFLLALTGSSVISSSLA